ncbi:hypothetical protein PLICRDRAFT_37401 [Plicaturopsis crispa FD-325 SS-3]|nr:hypothetical protein PLICRDRAFT_37401 [Plicaturopsis crispa FD-325 SS-3]
MPTHMIPNLQNVRRWRASMAVMHGPHRRPDGQALQMPMPASIVSANDDTLMLIIDAILDLTPQRTNLHYGRLLNPVRNLLPLSLTCKRLREQCLPIIFRQSSSRRRRMHPRSIRKYIQTLHLRDSEAVKTISLRGYIFNLSTFPALRRLVLQFSGRPSQMLLRAASTVPTLDDLDIECARFDGPRLFGLSRFTHLRRLALSIYLPPEPSPNKEVNNVRSYLHSLSPQLEELEVLGDFCGMCTLADTSWPRLHSLTMTGHAPGWDKTDIPTTVARMPCLRTLNMDFSVCRQNPSSNIPPFLYLPRTQCEGLDVARMPFPEALPHLTSLTLSQVAYPFDAILDHLPERLVSLKVLARKDTIPHSFWDERPFILRSEWRGYNPLSLSTAFRVAHRIAQMPALTELVLSLDCVPPPELVQAISRSCPRLTVLELADKEYGQWAYGEEQEHGVFSSLDAMADALCGLRELQTLRISVAYFSPTGQVMLAERDDDLAPFHHFVEMLAQRMVHLKFVWITCLRYLKWQLSSARSVIDWYRYVIYVDGRGRPYARGEFLLSGLHDRPVLDSSL